VRPKTIGLTGGIGSGKSTVASMLADLGAVVINADAVGHDIYRPHTDGWRQVTAAFGPSIVCADQTIDRAALGAIVFADPAELRRLNAIVHPLIAAEIHRRIDALRAEGTAAAIVVEAAVLIEAGWQRLVDTVWLVVAGRTVVTERITTQRGLSADDVARRIDSQLSDDERRRFADVVIENTGSLDALRHEVARLWQHLVAPAA
jgi:dephospho-CoA kinase